ncbi:MAG: hypothetical protein IKF64_07260 [Eubacterium sp.]|nr:hypothetical protein [Eubacterium sp.]
MKKRIFTALLAMLIIITAIPIAAHASDAPEVKAFGTDSTFLSAAPISTVRIDNSKITRDNVVLYHPDYSVGFRLDDDGYVYAPKCGVKSGYTGLAYFTLTFANAAILADGTRKNLVVKFNDVTTIGKNGTASYYDYLKFARITNNANMPLVYAPLSVNEKKHIAVRSAITFSVSNAGDSDTMIFAANQINTNRIGNDNFAQIVDASGHYCYSESMEPLGGIADGSDIYTTENSALNVVEGKTSGSYGIRFVGSGSSNGDYSEGFATVGTAKSGFSSRVWSSAGTNVAPLEIAFFTPVNAFSLETAAGEKGSISLWADGTVNSTEAAELSGGTTSAPLTYSVPGGKDVTLAITPDYGYEIDTLSINGQEAQPTSTQYQPNGGVSYELEISDIAADTAVCATFKKAHIHNLSYVNCTNDFGIEVICSEDGCPWTDSKLTVSANVPDKITFLSPQVSSITLSGKDDLANATHNYVQAKLTYQTIGENPIEYTSFPNACTDYNAVITITDSRDTNNVKTYSVSKTFTFEKKALEPALILENWTYGEAPINPRLALSSNPEHALVAYYYKPEGADDSAYTTDMPVNAGKYTLKAVRPETAHYKEGVAINGITIYQAASNPSVPTGITAVYGTKLSDVALPSNWTWDNDEQLVGNVGDNTFSATYTPDDAVNYTTVQADINVNVTKRPITITADDKKSFKGFSLADLTYTVDGRIVDGDNLGVSLNTNANSDVVGSYEITVAAANPNYNITLVGGTYTINEAPKYSFVGDSEIIWTQGSEENAEFTVVSDIENDLVFGKFTDLNIDGKTVGEKNYIASSGSLKVSLKADYLNTLAPGEHTVLVSFVDGNVQGILNVLAPAPITDDEENTNGSENEEAEENEETADSENTADSKSLTSPATGNNAEIYFSAFIAFALILLATIVFKKRLNNN